jgi:hypothetical protein
MIQSSPSERIQVSSIEYFFDEIWEFRDQVSSYLEQLVQYLPDLENPLLIAGVNPDQLDNFIKRLIIISDELEIEGETERKIISYQKSLRLLKSWIGDKAETEDGKVIQLKKNTKPVYKPGEVLIPVVEQFKTADGKSGIGRLRQLRVDILGENKKGNTELKPAFGVVGKDSGSFLEGVAKASEHLLSVSKKGKYKKWKATASLSMSHAWHAGRSANVALAAAFYCEMLKAEEMAEFFRLNPAICVSGDVDEFGNVLPVEEESLALKTEAAFFSWVQVLVVPIAQLELVQKLIERLKEQFPNRELPVFGISKVEEIFYDRRLTIHHKTDAIVHNFRKIWKRKFSVASVITVIALLGIIARLVYGPVDKNPTYVTYEGEFAEIRNSSGAVLESINVGERYVDYFNSTSKIEVADHLKFVDVNNDGINEVLENNTPVSYDDDEKENFVIRTIDGDTLFNKVFKLEIKFDKHPYLRDGIFQIRRFSLTDLDRDGNKELLMILMYAEYFTNIVAVIDIETQDINEMYVHSGYIRDMHITDLDNDGFDDILLAAELKAFREKGLIVLDSRFLNGKGVLGERYKKSDMEKAIEKALIIIPQTTVGKILSQYDFRKGFEKGFPEYIRTNKENRFTFYVDDWEVRGGEDGAGMLFEFYNDLSIRAIVSRDSYDIEAKELLDSGVINFEADGLFMDTYRDSLLYWNGTEFQFEPTLNKKYLESVGDDSTFYKEFFFNTYE